MNVDIINDEKNRYVTNLTCSDDFLTWSNSDDEYFLVVQSEFGVDLNINDRISGAISSLEKLETFDEIKVSSEVSAYLLKKSEGLLAYRCEKRPARYSVFVCDYNKSDQLKIYAYSDHTQFVDIDEILKFSMEDIHVDTPHGGLFSKLFGHGGEPAAKPCVRIKLIGSFPVGYKDGSLYYTFSGFKYKYKITEEMLREGFTVPLYNGKRPEICSFSQGFIGEFTR